MPPQGPGPLTDGQGSTVLLPACWEGSCKWGMTDVRSVGSGGVPETPWAQSHKYKQTTHQEQPCRQGASPAPTIDPVSLEPHALKVGQGGPGLRYGAAQVVMGQVYGCQLQGHGCREGADLCRSMGGASDERGEGGRGKG